MKGFYEEMLVQLNAQVSRLSRENETLKGNVMNAETQKLWQALTMIYGSDLQAVTVTMLLKDSETAVRFVTLTIPQKEI